MVYIMADFKQAKHVSSLIRLRQRLRMVGSSMLSVDPEFISAFPISLSTVFAAIEALDAEIKTFDMSLKLSGGGGD